LIRVRDEAGASAGALASTRPLRRTGCHCAGKRFGSDISDHRQVIGGAAGAAIDVNKEARSFFAEN
jgi:hypothetical protein